ncbi:TonB-dependent receptor [Phenylobacterium sp.]|uniref:TonB-dependent receptor n=1 Tax=Phenylobacterium sp. TaxID=1871053 RepID=UPI002E33AA68|nr:TonB-dependent receptor [Phenylobacterium sp.]
MLQDNHHVRNRLRLLTASALAIVCLFAQPAAAQPTVPVSIPAGSLESGLHALAAQTHQQLLYSVDLVAGRRIAALYGEYTPEDALQRLLAGSGIVATRAGPSAIVLKTAGRAVPASTTPAPAPASAEDRSRERPFGGEAGYPAPAEIAPAAPALSRPNTVAEVEVIGTHLRGVTDSPSPVQVISRADLDRSGYQTVAEALQVLPQNFAGAGAENVVALATDRSSGNSFYASGVNLRGLGPNATLTLINGRRLAGTGSNGDFADLSTLPSGAVERVEVLMDGASALYGSDAVGGVVNVIMRRRYDGAETRISDGVATQGAPAEFQVSQSFGRTWDGGGLVLAFEHNQRGELLARDRAVSASADLRPEGGTDRRIAFSHPGNILRVDPVTGASAPFWAIPAGQNGVGLQPGQFVANTVNLEEPLAESAILPRQVSDSGYASISQSLGERLELSADVTFGRRRFKLPTGTVFSSFSVSRANPFYVSPIGAASETIQYAFDGDLPPGQLKGSSENVAATAGADWRLFGDWRLSAYGAFAQDHSRTAQTGLLNSTSLSEALGNSPDNPATPYSAARDGFFNPFGDGRVNTAAVDHFIGAGFSVSDTRDRVTSGDIKLDGTLFNLPAGPLRAALGADIRREQFRRSGMSFTSGVAPAPSSSLSAARDVTAAYAEVRAPLLASDSPIGGLDLSLAGRLEHYSDFGTTRNPKLGLIWTPSSDLRVRASYGTSFRAPSLPQLFGFQLFTPNRLPRGVAGNVLVIQLQGSSPALTPETARSWSLGFDYTPSWMAGLRVSASWFNTDFTNRIDQPVRQSLATALTDPAYAPFVTFVSPSTNAADLARVQALIASPLSLSLGAFPATQYGAIVDSRYVNTGSLQVAGLDAQVAYGFDVAATHLEVGANGAYLSRYDVGITPTSATLNRLDVANFPVRFRGRATATATRGLFTGQIALNYVNGYHGALGQSIDSQLTTDLQLRAVAPAASRFAGLSATLSVRNLFDRKPPFYDSPAQVGYDPANADPIGRFVALQLVKTW